MALLALGFKPLSARIIASPIAQVSSGKTCRIATRQALVSTTCGFVGPTGFTGAAGGVFISFWGTATSVVSIGVCVFWLVTDFAITLPATNSAISAASKSISFRFVVTILSVKQCREFLLCLPAGSKVFKLLS